jgi:hypothetical protein
VHIGLIRGPFWQHVDSGDQVVARIADAFKQRGVRNVFGDQRESMMTSSAFARHGLRFHECVWTGPKKEAGIATARRWFADRTIVFAGPHDETHDRMRDELLSFEERISASGAFTYGARGRRHDDLVALVLTCAIADSIPVEPGEWPGLPGSPHRPPALHEVLIDAFSRGDTSPVTRAMSNAGLTLAHMPDYRTLRKLIR